MSEIADKLDEARALIEMGWCQGGFAFDADGNSVAPAEPSACAFCVGGAIMRVNGAAKFGDVDGQYWELRDAFLRAIGGNSVVDFNDAPERTQAEVIEAFRKAADLARSEAAAVGGR